MEGIVPLEIPVVPVGKRSFGEKFLRRNGSFRKESLGGYGNLFISWDSDVTKGDG